MMATTTTTKAQDSPAPAQQPDLAQQPPLAQLAARLPQMVAKAGHSEMWGVKLAVDEGLAHAPTQVVLSKFMRANNNDVDGAEKQLVAALEWRKAMDAASLAAQPFDARRFGGLGFVTTHRHDGAANDVVITWNVYGAVKDNKATFGNVADFIKWRAALMELGLQKMGLADITEPLADGAEDPYRMMQVHDYRSVNFFRMDPDVKAASRETIHTFSMAYPELLSYKYFVNVPAIMGWVFGAMRFFLAPDTLRKFHPLASGTGLAAELPGVAATLPREYGGQGPSVTEGVTVLLTDEAAKDASASVAGEANEARERDESAAAAQGNPAEAIAEPKAETKVETEPTPPSDTKAETKAETQAETQAAAQDGAAAPAQEPAQ